MWIQIQIPDSWFFPFFPRLTSGHLPDLPAGCGSIQEDLERTAGSSVLSKQFTKRTLYRIGQGVSWSSWETLSSLASATSTPSSPSLPSPLPSAYGKASSWLRDRRKLKTPKKRSWLWKMIRGRHHSSSPLLSFSSHSTFSSFTKTILSGSVVD